ncbi:MAG: ketoacyl-ACP synthase III [Planctomycetaceae bacterium]|jgi:3-oxoacyl-[acyl-carrier-protein] synthase-3|nr:ketoacyl-ACP synthase III [Planctomycetaceae bacterium]
MRILGISCAVPTNVIYSDEFIPTFGEGVVKKIVANTGVVERRHVKSGCTSDLVTAAAERLFEETHIDKNTIDALIFVTQTPDYLTPATSGILQHRLGLSQNIITFDVNHGCTGYTDGLILTQSLLKGLGLRKVLLLVGDTLSKIVSPQDQSSALLFGDAGSATLLENSDDPFYFVAGRDGAGSMCLYQNIGYRNGLHVKNQIDSKNDLVFHMDGLKVYGFTIDCVPKMTKNLLEKTDWLLDSVDYFLLHQANLFMIRNLAKIVKIPIEKVPIGIENFGNTSGTTIPMLFVNQMRNKLLHGSKLILEGFGIGLAWAGVALEWKDGIICPLVEIDC